MNKNVKKRIATRIIQAITAIVVFALALPCFSYMLMPKSNSISSGIKNPNAMQFVSEPTNSLDLMIVGNSNAYSGFSPLELWNEYGITSYVSGEGRQSVAEAASIIEKTFENQKPKVVIIESDEFYAAGSVLGQAKQNVQSKLEKRFSVFLYHNRWKVVKPKEALSKPNYNSKSQTKGQYISSDIIPYKGKKTAEKTDKVKKISKINQAFLNKIKKQCEQNGAKLMIVGVPSDTSWTYEKHNGVKEYADKNDIDFIDYNLKKDDINFNHKTDYRDGGKHLNSSGAKKLSLDLGKYLVENYQIKSHKNDSKYSKDWNKSYQTYKFAYENHINSKQMY